MKTPMQAKRLTASHAPAQHKSVVAVSSAEAYNAPDIQTQMENATRFGHSLGKVPVQPNILAPATGCSLPEAVQRKMEGAFGQDFADVRIHEGPQASSIGALAYTRGTDVHFAPGTYQPESTEGQALIGHELAHVVQQREGRVAVHQGKDAPINADTTLEHEADTVGMQAAQGNRVHVRGAMPGLQSHSTPIQMKKGKRQDEEQPPPLPAPPSQERIARFLQRGQAPSTEVQSEIEAEEQPAETEPIPEPEAIAQPRSDPYKNRLVRTPQQSEARSSRPDDDPYRNRVSQPPQQTQTALSEERREEMRAENIGRALKTAAHLITHRLLSLVDQQDNLPQRVLYSRLAGGVNVPLQIIEGILSQQQPGAGSTAVQKVESKLMRIKTLLSSIQIDPQSDAPLSRDQGAKLNIALQEAFLIEGIIFHPEMSNLVS
jgi:hypothetical protein